MPKHNYIIQNVPESVEENYIKTILKLQDEKVNFLYPENLERIHSILINSNPSTTFIFIVPMVCCRFLCDFETLKF